AKGDVGKLKTSDSMRRCVRRLVCLIGIYHKRHLKAPVSLSARNPRRCIRFHWRRKGAPPPQSRAPPNRRKGGARGNPHRRPSPGKKEGPARDARPLGLLGPDSRNETAFGCPKNYSLPIIDAGTL